MVTKTRLWFYLRVLANMASGAAVSFILCSALGMSKNLYLAIALGLLSGLVVGFGILFFDPKTETKKTKITGYGFWWPGLTIGFSLAIIWSGTKIPHLLSLGFSCIAGFILILAAFSYKIYHEEKEGVIK